MGRFFAFQKIFAFLMPSRVRPVLTDAEPKIRGTLGVNGRTFLSSQIAGTVANWLPGSRSALRTHERSALHVRSIYRILPHLPFAAQTASSYPVEGYFGQTTPQIAYGDREAPSGKFGEPRRASVSRRTAVLAATPARPRDGGSC